MKILIAVVALALCLNGSAEDTLTNQLKEPSAEQKAIVRVYRERFLCLLNHSDILIKNGRIVSWRPEWVNYNNALQKIDADDCPKAFKLAWFDYKAGVKDMVRHPLGEAGMNMAKARTATGAAVIGVAAIMSEHEKVEDLWTKAKRAALECDVDLEKIKF